MFINLLNTEIKKIFCPIKIKIKYRKNKKNKNLIVIDSAADFSC